MNVLTLTKEKIINNKNGLIVADYDGANSVSFFAELPKSAVVDRIKVGGVFINDLPGNNTFKAHVDRFEEYFKVGATVYFSEDARELYDKLANYQIDEFEVYYHLEFVTNE